ncbi:MAG: hypothetical protein L6R37_008332 [Teloschistes peruensis]|nr:MAG: hypothetical protein L6R37_008332 [Teloschistes peruensis]
MDAFPNDGSTTAARIAHECISIFFFPVGGLTHTTTFALSDLSTHTEYLEPLRQELRGGWDELKKTAEGLPLLDSFIKESTRMNGTVCTSGRRKALAPFTFSDGLHVPTGAWVCVPTRSINRDAKIYRDPLMFDGFRFARENPSRFTDVTGNWLVWGSGNVICPGRFYTSLIIKFVLAHVLRNYDLEMADPLKPRSFGWRASIVPRADITVILKPREE